eukprot:GHRR01031333.1.p1 GENE.GHRR01031333.1~~GHRR01031333.1.p1  ORF type:complete len:522 (+),score=163.88 GHRR01031333.1:1128-2693(+)
MLWRCAAIHWHSQLASIPCRCYTCWQCAIATVRSVCMRACMDPTAYQLASLNLWHARLSAVLLACQGQVVGCGVQSIQQQCTTAAESALVVKKLIKLGLTVVGQGSIQPCNYPTLGNNIRNPALGSRLAGGGTSGAVAAIASRRADLAVSSDYLGSLRLPAACMGLYAYVGTPNCLGAFDSKNYVSMPSNSQQDATTHQAAADGTASSSNETAGSDGTAPEMDSDTPSISRTPRSNNIESVGMAAAELPVLCRVAACLGLPGAANLRHEVTQIVVAEDMFQQCDPDMSPGVLVVKRAVLSWAGQEQAGSVQLLDFLAANTHSWKRLAATAGIADSAGSLEKQPSSVVLGALKHAAKLLYHAELADRYSAVAAAASAEELGLEVAAALQSGATTDEQQLALASSVAHETQDVLRTAVKKDVVVVMPITPSAPPRLDASSEQMQSWLDRTHAFAALTALGGCPSVVLPVGTLPDGAPLSLALFGQARTDQRLLAVADRLVPHIQVSINHTISTVLTSVTLVTV